MLTVTIANFAEAMQVSAARAGVMLRGLPYTHRGHHAPRKYCLAAILPTLNREKYRSKVPALLAFAVDDGELYVGDDEQLGDALARWIEEDPEMRERLKRVRGEFAAGLAGSTQSSRWLEGLERVRSLLPTSQYVMPFVLTADKSGLPDMNRYARAFTLIHSSPYREAA